MKTCLTDRTAEQSAVTKRSTTNHSDAEFEFEHFTPRKFLLAFLSEAFDLDAFNDSGNSGRGGK